MSHSEITYFLYHEAMVLELAPSFVFAGLSVVQSAAITPDDRAATFGATRLTLTGFQIASSISIVGSTATRPLSAFTVLGDDEATSGHSLSQNSGRATNRARMNFPLPGSWIRSHFKKPPVVGVTLRHRFH